MSKLRHEKFRWPRTAAAAGLTALAVFAVLAPPARAELAPLASRCPGNICTGAINVGSDTVNYAYTQHINPNGEFRIRLNGGAYNTNQLISYIIFGLPAFAGWDKFAGPGASYLTEEDVNPGRTAYERRESGGCAGCKIDQVMTVKYSGLTEGKKSFNLFVLQNGGSAGKNGLEFYVDAGAPSNTNEAQPFPAIDGMALPCADRWPVGPGGTSIDNDLNYKPNCADPACDGQQGDPINDALRCEKVEQTCWDHFDNDGNGKTDCADVSCDRRIGRQPPDGPVAYCEYGNEYGAPLSLDGTSPCSDNFDNDADGRPDCYDNRSVDIASGAQKFALFPTDAALDPNICWRHPEYGCPTKETSCTDSIDNDIDIPYSDNQYPEADVEANLAQGKPFTAQGYDCRDYDCGGNPACPAQENHTASGDVNDCQCFNGIDDDLDHKIDCADPDCTGAYCDANQRTCVDKEFDLANRINLCGNFANNDINQPIDDDGDGPANCLDSDCKQKFGDCGPCPNREDITFDACADGRDNDVNGLTDCRDPRCVGKLGSVDNAAYCAGPGAETGAMCRDGFDNDNNGRTDCQDPNCNGAAAGPAGQSCEYPSEKSCGDGFDNDGNGKIDCLDPACAGKDGCHALDWTPAACVQVPRLSAWKNFTANEPTVRAQSNETVRINGQDLVHLQGTAVYSSITIVVGDNTDPAKYYPYAASTCGLTGTNAGSLSITAVPGHALMIFNSDPNAQVDGFDLTLTCATPAAPALAVHYPISISMLKSGEVPEYGEADFQTRLYEDTPPTIVDVEPEGAVGGVLKVPYGGKRGIRVVPADPNTPPLYSSGICQCSVNLAGNDYHSADGFCGVAPGYQFTRDYNTGDTPDSLTISAGAQDGADNLSAAPFNVDLHVNVTPVMTEDLAISPPNGLSKPFFNKKLASTINVSAKFMTAENGKIGSTCDLYITTADGTEIGPGAIKIDNLLDPIPPDNDADCVGANVPLPVDKMPDGQYFVSVAVVDEDLDPAVSNRRPLFMCDHVPSPADDNFDPNDGNVCHWADFDGDGATEGFYTTLFSKDPKACDNCVNLLNPDQSDRDADGIGDACTPDQVGRCEIDTDINCTYNSLNWDDPKNPGTCPGGASPPCCPSSTDTGCCPGPTVKTNAAGPNKGKPVQDAQACRKPWGACSTGGEICFTPENCPPRGRCSDGVNQGELCNSDDGYNGENGCPDKDGNPIDGACVGADLCENLMYPWVQTPQGNVYSGRYIKTPEPPPAGQNNATFCIEAKSGITWKCSQPDPLDPTKCDEQNRQYFFTSEQCGTPATTPQSRFERPKAKNSYSTVLGRLDVAGLLSGKYGDVTEVTDKETFAQDIIDQKNLGGRIYLVHGDLNIGTRSADEPPPTPDKYVIQDADSGGNGAGTIIVEGGNLYFWADLEYQGSFSGKLDSLARLASIGWIVLDVTDPLDSAFGSKGNVYVGKEVQELVGAFFIGGQGGVYTVAPPDTESDKPLTVRGLMVGRQFHFSRGFKSPTQASERVIYDGRAVANPPPGFGDMTKTLPNFGDVPSSP